VVDVAVEVAVVVVGAVDVVVVVVVVGVGVDVEGPDCCVCAWFGSLNCFNFSVTASTSRRRAIMSLVEGVRASSFEFSMLSSSKLVGVLVKVGANGVLVVLEGM